jgi:hypothetical protein
MNAITAIHPYKANGLWVFDDPAVGLRQEPFIAGADTILDRLVETIPEARQGFTLLFSGQPFPDSVELLWRRAEAGGNTYYCPELDCEGWLCPALLKYFDEPPKRIYARAMKRVVD